MKRFLSGDWVPWMVVGGILLFLAAPFLGAGILLAKYGHDHPGARPVIEGLFGLFYVVLAVRILTSQSALRKPGETRLRQILAGVALSLFGLSRFIPAGDVQSGLIVSSLLCWLVCIVRRPRRFFAAT